MSVDIQSLFPTTRLSDTPFIHSILPYDYNPAV